MSKNKKKFDLTNLVHHGLIKEGETLCFVSDPKQTCTVTKMPNHEFKVTVGKSEAITIHAFAQKCLGQEPPDHASKWIKNQAGKTLYDLWQEDLGAASEAA
ncbi:MAG TPA: hypothetical protein VL588_09020 [Bdellovibrionota bacterium]|nr:hypothetical protein [Bdellovibrionota bacterium]